MIIWEIDRPVPLLSDDEHFTLEELKIHFHQNEHVIRSYIINLFQNWLKDDRGYPETSLFWEWLQNVEFELLASFYTTIFDRLNKSNGYVVDYNPILMYCTKSHHNASLLGGTEQSNAAMLYVSPYVVKGKIELALTLAIMENTRKHIKLFPSTAADVNTNVSQRQVQHFLTRCLNKMNTLVELSDYQVAADLLNLPCQITTDVFTYMSIYGYMSYNTHVQCQQKTEIYRDKLFERLNDQLDHEETLDEIDRQFLDLNEDQTNHDYNDDHDHDGVDSVVTQSESIDNNSDTSQNDDFSDEDSSDEMEKDLQLTSEELKTRLQDFLVSFGAVAIYDLEESINGSDPIRGPIPYVACYSHRGEKLKYFSRYEYASLVQIKKKKAVTHRKRGMSFEFCTTFPLQRCYAQFLHNKQRTVIFNGKAPRHPGPEHEENTKQYSKWQEQADRYARYYLTAFRCEPECYSGHHQNCYDYSWNAFQEWIHTLQHDDSVLSKLRLSALNTRLHSLKATFKSKVLINKYRARARDMWSEQQKDRYSSDGWYDQLSKFLDHEIIEELEYQNNNAVLSKRETEQLQLQIEDNELQVQFFDQFTQANNSQENLLYATIDNIKYSMIHTDHGTDNIYERAELIYEDATLETANHQLQNLCDVPEYIHIGDDMPPVVLNPKQQMIYSVYDQYLDDTTNQSKAPPRLALLTGSAGSGKSYVIQAITKKGHATNNPVLTTANNN